MLLLQVYTANNVVVVVVVAQIRLERVLAFRIFLYAHKVMRVCILVLMRERERDQARVDNSDCQ